MQITHRHKNLFIFNWRSINLFNFNAIFMNIHEYSSIFTYIFRISKKLKNSNIHYVSNKPWKTTYFDENCIFFWQNSMQWNILKRKLNRFQKFDIFFEFFWKFSSSKTISFSIFFFFFINFFKFDSMKLKLSHVKKLIEIRQKDFHNIFRLFFWSSKKLIFYFCYLTFNISKRNLKNEKNNVTIIHENYSTSTHVIRYSTHTLNILNVMNCDKKINFVISNYHYVNVNFRACDIRNYKSDLLFYVFNSSSWSFRVININYSQIFVRHLTRTNITNMMFDMFEKRTKRTTEFLDYIKFELDIFMKFCSIL